MPFFPPIVSTGAGGGGGGTPGGATTQIQYNDAGAFNGNAAFTYNNSTNTVTLGGELNIEGEVGQSASTAYLRVRDSSTNELFKIQGDGVMHNLRGVVSPIYRDAAMNYDVNMNVTTSADRTYGFYNPVSGDRNLILKSSPENGRGYVVHNIGTGNVINVRSVATGFIIAAISPQFAAQIIYDSVNWVNIL